MTDEARKKGMAVRMEKARKNENNQKATAFIKSLRKEGKSFYQIAKELNACGFRTSKGKDFQTVQVQRLFNRDK